MIRRIIEFDDGSKITFRCNISDEVWEQMNSFHVKEELLAQLVFPICSPSRVALTGYNVTEEFSQLERVLHEKV